jgi:hypothetical protein
MPLATAASVPYLKDWSEKVSNKFLGKGSLHPRSVNVVVASLQGVVDGIFLAVGILPSAKAKGRDGGTGVELELCRHFVSFLGDFKGLFCVVFESFVVDWMQTYGVVDLVWC